LQDTAESDAAKEAISKFFKSLQDTPPDQMFNPDETLYPLMGDKLAEEARLAAAAHDAQREQMLKEEGATAETKSRESLFEIEQGLFEPQAIEENKPQFGPYVATDPIAPQGTPAIPEDILSVPAEAGALLGDDYTELKKDVTDENTARRTRNERFKPRPPIDWNDPNVVKQADDIETVALPAFLEEKRINVEAHPEAEPTFALLQENIKKHGLTPRITGAAMEMLNTVGNEAMTDDEAVASITSMLTVFAENPKMPPYTAAVEEDPNYPPGLIRVTIKGGTPFWMPERAYSMIDELRANMAIEQVPATEQARAAVALAKQKAKVSADALNEQDTKGRATANEFYNVPPEPPVDTGEDIFPEYPVR